MGSYPPRIAILTCTNDLHALTIADRVERLFDARCDVIEVDTVATAARVCRGLAPTARCYRHGTAPR